MKTIYLIILLVIIYLSLLHFYIPKNQTLEQYQTNILFIGNSMVYKNHMYQLLEYFLGSNFKIDRAAQSGYTLRKHHKKRDFIPLLQNRKYDYIVLQEKSIVPLRNPQRLSLNVADILNDIDSIYKNFNYKPVLYQTWPNCIVNQPNPELAQEIISAAYFEASQNNGNIDIVRTGDALMKFRKSGDFNITDPIVLRCSQTDPRHPSVYGSILIALMFYKYFTGKKASTVPSLQNVPKNISARYQNLDMDIVNKLIQVADSMDS